MVDCDCGGGSFASSNPNSDCSVRSGVAASLSVSASCLRASIVGRPGMRCGAAWVRPVPTSGGDRGRFLGHGRRGGSRVTVVQVGRRDRLPHVCRGRGRMVDGRGARRSRSPARRCRSPGRSPWWRRRRCRSRRSSGPSPPGRRPTAAVAAAGATRPEGGEAQLAAPAWPRCTPAPNQRARCPGSRA